MTLSKTIHFALEKAFPASQIEVKDTQGNGYHFEVHIASTDFAGKTRVIQHQMVYKVLKDQINDGTLHAITIKTQER